MNDSQGLFVTAANVDHQAFANGYSYGTSQSSEWRIYAFTDRPAYRPKETLQWKFIARRFDKGVYTTPASQTLEYQINDPRGTKLTEGKVVLNSFGSSWGTLELGEQLPLGEYNIVFWDNGRHNYIGAAKLFRLEEYKLPEFKVQVKTPEQDGKKKAFRLGEQVEVNIEADYYFGGPVSNASVEVVVYQNPFYHYWYPRREYSWYYDDFVQQRRAYYGAGQVVKRETIKTDATGKAKLTFDTHGRITLKTSSIELKRESLIPPGVKLFRLTRSASLVNVTTFIRVQLRTFIDRKIKLRWISRHLMLTNNP
jgi:uncharacterized protein YfaS (alpha-2-macroglobulin family)